MEHPSSDPIDTDIPTDGIVEPTPEPINAAQSVKDEESSDGSKKKKGPAKTQAEILQRRREGRLKAAATIANNLKKTGISRVDQENGFPLTNIRQTSLINQKNYYADYLKKDEQVSFIRNWRAEKLMQTQNKNKLKKANKPDSGIANSESTNFADYNLGDIEAEMKRKREQAEKEAAEAAVAAGNDDDDEDEDEDADEEMSEEKARQGYDTIVIHPGSQYIRIGRATDAFPQTVPTVIAIPKKSSTNTVEHKPSPLREITSDGNIVFDEEFEKMREVVTKDFKARMKYYKRRILPNSRESAAGFNRKQEAEKIPDHNDPFKKEWLDENEMQNHQFFVGEDALKVPTSSKTNWTLRFPIVGGDFSERSEYSSPQEVMGDLSNIIFTTLSKMEIPKSEFRNLKVLLVIPDLYNKVYVEKWCELLFKHLNFGHVAIIQEAVAATFGAGTQSSCVVDVGAQTTTISCVDEGLIIPDSRIKLNFGGQQITETFIKLLLEQSFPYKDIDLSSYTDDWELAENLKKNYVTFQDSEIAVQHYNFYKRKPGKTTEKYEFKVFDEVMVAPLGLFYPDLFQIKDETIRKYWLFSPSTDQYSSKPNNPFSKAQENVEMGLIHADLADDQLLLEIMEEKNKSKKDNPFAKPKPTKTRVTSNYKFKKIISPLEKAIIESITNASITNDFARSKRLYDNLLIVGGGFAKIPAFDVLLTDRINIWRPKFLSSSSMDEILEYVSQENKKNEDKRNELILELKEKKLKQIQSEKSGTSGKIIKDKKKEVEEKEKEENEIKNGDEINNKDEEKEKELTIDDIELDASLIEKINRQTALELDLDYIDTLSDKGTLLPVNVLPPPREFDPEVLTWKGGCVYARLKVIQEMWISTNDWDTLESRSLYYKSIFNY